MHTRLFIQGRAVLTLVSLGILLTIRVVQADPAPDWKLQDVTGKTVSLSDFKGKVVVLDFWATWCPPCREEIPHFVDLQKQYGSQGLAVVGVSLDEGGASTVASFVKKHNINYTVVMGNADVAAQYGNIQAIPTTFVIDTKGNIVNKYEGFTEASIIEGDVKKLLPANDGK